MLRQRDVQQLLDEVWPITACSLCCKAASPLLLSSERFPSLSVSLCLSPPPRVCCCCCCKPFHHPSLSSLSQGVVEVYERKPSSLAVLLLCCCCKPVSAVSSDKSFAMQPTKIESSSLPPLAGSPPAWQPCEDEALRAVVAELQGWADRGYGQPLDEGLLTMRKRIAASGPGGRCRTLVAIKDRWLTLADAEGLLCPAPLVLDEAIAARAAKPPARAQRPASGHERKAVAAGLVLDPRGTMTAVSPPQPPSPLPPAVHAAFLRAVATVQAGTPGRDILIRQRMGAEADARLIADCIRRIDENTSLMAHLGVGLHLLEPNDTMHLVPSCKRCVVCNGELSLARRGHTLREFGEPISVDVYVERGMLKGKLHPLTCTTCSAAHLMSYAEGGSRLAKGRVMPYKGATDMEFFQPAKGLIMATSLLVHFEAQQVHSHTGYLTFGEEYAATSNQPRLYDAFRKRLAHAFLAWTLLRWRQELELPLQPVQLTTDQGLDDELLRAVAGADAADLASREHSRRSAQGSSAPLELADASLLYRFIDKWGRRHEEFCRRPLPGERWCKCFIVDGHMKGTRRVCENTNARLVDMGPEIGKAVLGCSGSPLPGSRFCRDCRRFCARAAPGPRPAGSQGTTVVDFDVDVVGDAACGSCEAPGDSAFAFTKDATKAAEAAAEQAATEMAEEETLKPGEGNVYLAEALVGHRPMSKRNSGGGHGNCIRKQLMQYEVKWVGYPSDANTWQCESEPHPVHSSQCTQCTVHHSSRCTVCGTGASATSARA